MQNKCIRLQIYCDVSVRIQILQLQVLKTCYKNIFINFSHHWRKVYPWKLLKRFSTCCTLTSVNTHYIYHMEHFSMWGGNPDTYDITHLFNLFWMATPDIFQEEDMYILRTQKCIVLTTVCDAELSRERQAVLDTFRAEPLLGLSHCRKIEARSRLVRS